MSVETESSARLARRIEAAQGRIPCDLALENVRFLDVFSCRWRAGTIGVVDGTIVGLQPGLPARRRVDASGLTAVPGFIDAHVHVESSMMLPDAFEAAVLPRGTTSVVCDPHEIANVAGPPGLEYFLHSAQQLSVDLWVMLSSCVPATHLETNGAGRIGAETLAPLAAQPHALGLAEMMNVPGVLSADPEVLAKLTAFAGSVIDGHCPLLSGQGLAAYAAAGISSCHESSEYTEAAEKLRHGLAVWIREGSVAKDLNALIPLLDMATSSSIGFCTDDRNPWDIATEGHIDHLVRSAIAHGVAPELAYRTASWSAARHYGLSRGLDRVGAIAPGYKADLVLLEDTDAVAIRDVLKAGKFAAELETALPEPTHLLHTTRAQVPAPEALEGPSGRVHAIDIWEGKILTGSVVAAHDAPEIRRIAVLERHGHDEPPANGYVRGFGPLRGAIASSVGHDSHNLVVVGDRTDDMSAALAALIDCGGGFCVVRDGQELAKLALPYGGLMSAASPEQLRTELERLHAASRAIGCVLNEPFLQLAFLSLPVIPKLKLTNKGLVDVEAFDFLSVRAA